MSEDDLAGKLIADLRTRLLDLTNSNRLLSYKHPERAKTCVRVVDEQPDFLHDSLTNGKQLVLGRCRIPRMVCLTNSPTSFSWRLKKLNTLMKRGTLFSARRRISLLDAR